SDQFRVHHSFPTRRSSDLFIATHTFKMFRMQSEIRGEQTAVIDEYIGQQKVVQAFSHEDKSLDEFDEVNDRLEKCSLKAIFTSRSEEHTSELQSRFDLVCR